LSAPQGHLPCQPISLAVFERHCSAALFGACVSRVVLTCSHPPPLLPFFAVVSFSHHCRCLYQRRCPLQFLQLRQLCGDLRARVEVGGRPCLRWCRECVAGSGVPACCLPCVSLVPGRDRCPPSVSSVYTPHVHRVCVVCVCGSQECATGRRPVLHLPAPCLLPAARSLAPPAS
jgi:hypothetical protein